MDPSSPKASKLPSDPSIWFEHSNIFALTISSIDARSPLDAPIVRSIRFLAMTALQAYRAQSIEGGSEYVSK